MHLRHLLVALDESDEGRAALLMAADLARLGDACVTVLRVAQTPGSHGTRERMVDDLREQVAAQIRHMPQPGKLGCDVTFGLPGVEIARYAEIHGADLIVVGRKRRSALQRRLVGDTADAVGRRSSVPCLFVPAARIAHGRIVAALDGTERGLAVLVAAIDFAREVHGRLRAMTVEPLVEQEVGGRWLRTGRSERLARAVNSLRQTSGLAAEYWEVPEQSSEGGLVVYRGAVVENVLSELTTAQADVLVIGYHRGGPVGVLEAGSVGRRLSHEAPCSVLTVPL